MEAVGGLVKSYFSEIWGLISLDVTHTRMRSEKETATNRFISSLAVKLSQDV